MKKYEECRAELMKLLASEYNCTPDAFDSDKNLITISAPGEGRSYARKPAFFSMVTLGGNAVITADERIHTFLRKYTDGKVGHHLFELEKLIPIEKELESYDHNLTGTFNMFLPCNKVKSDILFDLKWYFDKEIHVFYGNERFPNAICERYQPERPDRIVVCAMDGDKVMGMAGCSEDAPGWMQIGIDVMPGYRSRGIGTALVNVLKNKIEEQGDIPFYGTSASNYHSWNIALNCGFRPAWVEVGSKKI